MKRIIYLIMFLSGSGVFAQSTIDDGQVTRFLSVNTSDPFVSNFTADFSLGITKFKEAVYPTMNDLLQKEGYDLVNQPKMEDWLAAEKPPVSPTLLQKLIAIKNDIGVQYLSVDQIRQELASIAKGTNWLYYEAAFLASMDIAMQAIHQNFELHDAGIGQFAVFSNQTKWPKWLRCVFGIVGGAIGGSLHGAALGSPLMGVGLVAGAGTGFIAGGISGGANAC